MIEEIWYMYFTGGTEMSQSYTWQPLSRVLTRNLHVLAVGAGTCMKHPLYRNVKWEARIVTAMGKV